MILSIIVRAIAICIAFQVIVNQISIPADLVRVMQTNYTEIAMLTVHVIPVIVVIKFCQRFFQLLIPVCVSTTCAIIYTWWMGVDVWNAKHLVFAIAVVDLMFTILL